MDERVPRASGVGTSPYVVMPHALYESAGIVPKNTARPANLRERVLVRRPADLPGVEHWRAEHSTRLWTVYHQTYTFCVADSAPGPQAWNYRRGSYGMKEGISTMLIEPGEVHVTTRVPLASFHVLLVDPGVIAREFADELRPPGQHFAAGQTDNPAVAQAFLAVCRAIENPSGTTAERRAALRCFLLVAFGTAGERPPLIESAPCERAALRARDLLRKRYTDSVLLDDIAAEAGVSKYHLERSFRARFGVPIHRYLKLVRLSHARRLLQSGRPGAAVAQETGFSDSAHLGRVFRADLGFTPGTYARAGGDRVILR